MMLTSDDFGGLDDDDLIHAATQADQTSFAQSPRPVKRRRTVAPESQHETANGRRTGVRIDSGTWARDSVEQWECNSPRWIEALESAPAMPQDPGDMSPDPRDLEPSPDRKLFQGNANGQGRAAPSREQQG